MKANAGRIELTVRANMLTIALRFGDHAYARTESSVQLTIDAERAFRFTGDLLFMAGYEVTESERGQHLPFLNVYRVRQPSGQEQVAWTFFQHGDGLLVRATEHLDFEQVEVLALALAEQYGWEVTP